MKKIRSNQRMMNKIEIKMSKFAHVVKGPLMSVKKKIAL